MKRIALCPADGSEMTLGHKGFEMEAWNCPQCGEVRTVLARGVTALPTAPLDAYARESIEWVEREVDPRFGRILDQEGG